MSGCTIRALRPFEHFALNCPSLSAVEICELASNGLAEEVEVEMDRKGRRVITTVMLVK